MTKIPLIGLSGRRTHGHRQAGYAQELHHLDLDLYFADYARAIVEAGGLPVHLPLDVDPGLATKRLDGVLLTGGADIDPIRFDADRHPEVTTIERERSLVRAQSAASFAKRFAAKEACSKALGTGMRRGVFWRDMGVVNLPGGRPTLKLTGGAARQLATMVPPDCTAQIDLTLTDDFPWAQAIVIISAVPGNQQAK